MDVKPRPKVVYHVYSLYCTSPIRSNGFKCQQIRQGATNQNPRPLLQRAVTLSSPSIRVVSSRARAKTTQTPLALTERQRTRQGIVWILKAAEKGRKGGVPRETRIAKEVLAVLEGNSDVFKWLDEKHKVATANRYVWAMMVMGG
jgi:small subunit ribosomal protein S7